MGSLERLRAASTWHEVGQLVGGGKDEEIVTGLGFWVLVVPSHPNRAVSEHPALQT